MTEQPITRAPLLHVSRGFCLLLAALVWTLPGVGLLTVGTIWSIQYGRPLTLILLPLALAGGLAKAFFALRRATRRIVDRIRARGDRQPLIDFLPWHLWLLIALMILMGRLLRTYVLPPDVAGLVYVAVGVALLLSSRTLWAGWRHGRHQPT